MTKFDKDIRNKLDGYSAPVHPEMWSRIASSLPEKEKTPLRYWLLPGLTLIVVALALVLGYDSWKDNGHQGADLPAEAHVSALESDLADVQSIGSEVKDASAFGEETNLNAANNLPSGSSKTNAGSALSAPIPLTRTSQNSTDSKFLGNQDTDRTQDAVLQGASVERKKGVGTVYEQYNTIMKMASAIRNQDKDNTASDRSVYLPTIGNVDDYTASMTDERQGLAELLSGKRTICPSFNTKRLGIFAELYYSNDFGMRDLAYSGSATEFDYIGARDNTENAQYSFSAGARFSFLLPNGIGAKTGFAYAQINERFKYENPEHKQTKTIVIKEYIFENNVIVDSTETTKEIDVEGNLQIVSQNRYKVVDLPLLLTYEWGYNNRWYYSVTAGPMFNIRFAQKGKFLNPETLSPVDFSSDDSGNYKAFNTNLGGSLYLSFGLNYKTNMGADIFIEPNMRHFLNNLTVNTYELKQNYTVFGLGFGVKYKL